MNRPIRVCIVKAYALGDVIRTTGILAGLRSRYDNVYILWITSPEALPLLRNNPSIDLVIPLHMFADYSWTEQFDWTINLDEELDSCEVAMRVPSLRFSGVYVSSTGRRYSADTAQWFGMGLLRPIGVGGKQKADEIKKTNRSSYIEIITRCLDLPAAPTRPQLHIPDTARISAATALLNLGFDPNRLLIGLNTAAGKRWKLKTWPEDYTSELARLLVSRLNAACAILGGAEERERTQRIATSSRSPHVAAVPPVPILEFAALIQRLSVLVTSDSLALHIAAATDTVTVAFFGPTSAAEATIGSRGEKIVAPIDCVGCYRPMCEVRPNCMELLTPQRLFDAIELVLSRQLKRYEVGTTTS